MTETQTAAKTTATWTTTKGLAEGDLIANTGKPKVEPTPAEFSEVLEILSGGQGKRIRLANGKTASFGHATKVWLIKGEPTPDMPDFSDDITSDTDGDLAPAPIAAPAAQPAKRPIPQATRCECGCGKMAARRFLPGHDAKLKGQLIRTVLAGGKGADKAQAELASRGWDKFLKASQAKAAKVSAKRAELEAKNLARVEASKAKRAAAKAAKAAK